MQPLALAWGFLTVLPTPAVRDPKPSGFGRAAALFPFVGLLIGLLLAGVDAVSRLLWPEAVAAALTLGIAILLTGALHLDGFLDTCDGIFLWRPERRLEVMRDSHVGGFAVAGGLALYGIKLTALATIGGPARIAGLILAPTLARLTMTIALALFPYARPAGAGSAFKEGVRHSHAAVALATSLLAAAWWGTHGLALVVVAVLLSLLLAVFIRSRLGGLTGDTYGFISECVETATFLAVASPLGNGLRPLLP